MPGNAKVRSLVTKQLSNHTAPLKSPELSIAKNKGRKFGATEREVT